MFIRFPLPLGGIITTMASGGAPRGHDERGPTARDRLLDAGIDLIAQAPPESLLGFIGPNVVAAEAGASTGALYHHWPEGQAQFLRALVDEITERTAADIAERLRDVVTVDELAHGLVGALVESPLVRVLGVPDLERIDVRAPIEAVLGSDNRSRRDPWTIEGICHAVLGLALGTVALGGDDHGRSELILVDGLRALLATTCSPRGDRRDFDTLIAENERPRAHFLRSPGVVLGLGEG
jgi:AcrR family transcriptional regulator